MLKRIDLFVKRFLKTMKDLELVLGVSLKRKYDT
jgi:hypothetical protein